MRQPTFLDLLPALAAALPLSLTPEARGAVLQKEAAEVDGPAVSAAGSLIGLEWTEDEVKLMLGLCDQDTGGKKDEMVERLVDFLAKPSASGKASIAEKEAEKKRKRDAKKERAAKKKERNKVKREKAKKKKEKDKAKREKAKAKKAAEAADSSDDEDSDADSGSDSEEEEEEDEAPPKKKKKKAPKEEEEEEESSDSDDELQIAALIRPKITDSILLEKIQALATKSDFETLSLKGIRKKLSEELKQDVTPYKKKIKQLVIETMQANAAAAPTEAS